MRQIDETATHFRVVARAIARSINDLGLHLLPEDDAMVRLIRIGFRGREVAYLYDRAKGLAALERDAARRR